MSVRVEPHPALLRWARARSGIEADIWEKRFPRYDSWVNGDTNPTLKQLEEFAWKTYTPVGFFFLDEPPMEEVPIPDLRTVRDLPVTGVAGQVSADMLDTVYVCQARQEWYRDSQLLNGGAPLEFVGSVALADSPSAVADQMRLYLDWTPETRDGLSSWEMALTRLRENAELVGVLVMISGIVGSNTHRKLDREEFRGFALADPRAAVVFVNGADSKAAQVSARPTPAPRRTLLGIHTGHPRTRPRGRLPQLGSLHGGTAHREATGRGNRRRARRRRELLQHEAGSGGEALRSRADRQHARRPYALHRGVPIARREEDLDLRRSGRAARGLVVAYLLDSDVLIRAKNDHYGFDFCPGFWDWLEAANAAASSRGRSARPRLGRHVISVDRGSAVADS